MVAQAKLDDQFSSFLQEERKDTVPARRGGQCKNKTFLPFLMVMTLDINKTGRGIHLLFSLNTFFLHNIALKFALHSIIKIN